MRAIAVALSAALLGWCGAVSAAEPCRACGDEVLVAPPAPAPTVITRSGPVYSEIPKTSRGGTSAGGLEKEVDKKTYGPSGGVGLGKQFSHYFLSRWYDLVDVADVSVGGGYGFMVRAQATKLAQFGGGMGESYHVGFRGRSAGVWKEKRTEVGVSLLYYQKVQRERITGWVENFRSDKMDLDTATVYANNNDRSFLGIGATVQLGVMVNAYVRPAQAADWVLGWVTIDVLDDDTGKPRRNKDL